MFRGLRRGYKGYGFRVKHTSLRFKGKATSHEAPACGNLLDRAVAEGQSTTSLAFTPWAGSATGERVRVGGGVRGQGVGFRG